MFIIYLFIIFLFGARADFSAMKECAFCTWQPCCFDNDEHSEVVLHLFTKVCFCQHIKSIFSLLQYNGIFMLAAFTQRLEASLYWCLPQCNLKLHLLLLVKKLHFTEIYLWFVTSELQFREMTLCFKMLCCICSRLKVKG